MNGLHTWAGVVLGALLFAVFWMGTLSVFDREIDRWMAPMTRVASADRVSLDSLHTTYEEAASVRAPTWYAILPTEREPMVRVTWRESSAAVLRLFEPGSGVAIAEPETWAGSRFLYPFHYMLHIRFAELGRWLVGAAAIAMLALCVSGIAIHRRIFTDFFVLSVARKPRRLALDLHTVTGVLGLPFHFTITLSGLVIFWAVYFPSPLRVAYQDDRQAFNADAFGTFTRPILSRPGRLASLDAMVDEAKRLWGGAVRYVLIWHPGDAAAYVQMLQADEASVGGSFVVSYFDGTTGVLLHRHAAARPVMAMQHFISGLHLIQFRHWTLRWLYFALGLSGCVLIASGYLFWLESRRRKHAALGLGGVRVVGSLTVGSVTGILMATLSFFVVNRLLPLGVSFLGQERAALEIWTFYLVWLAAFGHAWVRPTQAWMEQCLAIAVLAGAAVLLNWVTTGDHLVRSLSHHHLWPIAGMDLLLVAGAATALVAARRMSEMMKRHA